MVSVWKLSSRLSATPVLPSVDNAKLGVLRIAEDRGAVLVLSLAGAEGGVRSMPGREWETMKNRF